MTILLTGGAGYIGSHVLITLLKEGHKVVVTDNLTTSDFEKMERVTDITKKGFDFYDSDINNNFEIGEIIKEYKINTIIHCAGSKSVGESIEQPIEYYKNNVVGTLNLVEMALKHKVSNFIFSSSASVYGNNESPMSEDMELLQTLSPYAESKRMSERILQDAAKVNKGFNVSILRYFNPIGSHESGLIRESSEGSPNNLMPLIVDVANGWHEKLFIYGNDYDTEDGTCERDYIHVMDLAEGHVKALQKITEGVSIYNLGTGIPISVLKLVNAFKTINNVSVSHEVVGRREGDVPVLYAAVGKAYNELGWIAKRKLSDMCIDSWKK